jgi:hypothetical protein
MKLRAWAASRPIASALAWLGVFALGFGVVWWFTLQAEPDRLARECAQRYATARTAAESLVVDRWIPKASFRRTQLTGPFTCRYLRLRLPGRDSVPPN